MVRLQIGGIGIDMNEFDFELKWKHPIQNNLKGESSTYSTDITVPLTANNKTAFDYKIFLESGKTNKYLYGQLIVNGSTMPVRCYIQNFSNSGIKFYLEQFRKSAVGIFLKDTTTLDNLFLPQIQAGTKTDIILNLTDGSRVGSLPNIFLKRDAWTPRINVQARLLLQELATFYGVTLDNEPTNYDVFANQWKTRTGTQRGFKFDGSAGSDTYFTYAASPVLDFADSSDSNFIFVSGGNGYIDSPIPFDFYAAILKVQLDAPTPTGTYYDVRFGLKRYSSTDYLFIQDVPVSTTDSADNFAVSLNNVPPGKWYLMVSVNNVVVHGHVTLDTSGVKIYATANYSTLELADPNYSGYSDFGDLEFYPCWQNLPKITAKSLFETIAVCAGKMIEYSEDGTTIKFVNFETVFSKDNAIDVSDKLIEWKTKEFKLLSSNNATVNYADGRIIATVIVNDETLPTSTNSVATIDAIRIQDEALSPERNTTDLVLNERIDTHFEVIEKLQLLYTPLTTPILFEAEFMYFADNKRPLLVRQLGGIFIALESIISTKNTITLKLLKIA
jgi:hypothetical protein